MIALLSSYKKYILVIILVASLFFAFKVYIGKIMSTSYSEGLRDANAEWEKKSMEYDGLIKQSLENNKKLNTELLAVSDKKKKLEEELTRSVTNGQIEYNRSPASSQKCLDKDFIALYNKSMGE